MIKTHMNNMKKYSFIFFMNYSEGRGKILDNIGMISQLLT